MVSEVLLPKRSTPGVVTFYKEVRHRQLHEVLCATVYNQCAGTDVKKNICAVARSLQSSLSSEFGYSHILHID